MLAPIRCNSCAACMASVTPMLKAVRDTIGSARTPMCTICRKMCEILNGLPVNGATRTQYITLKLSSKKLFKRYKSGLGFRCSLGFVQCRVDRDDFIQPHQFKNRAHSRAERGQAELPAVFLGITAVFHQRRKPRGIDIFHPAEINDERHALRLYLPLQDFAQLRRMLKINLPREIKDQDTASLFFGKLHAGRNLSPDFWNGRANFRFPEPVFQRVLCRK